MEPSHIKGILVEAYNRYAQQREGNSVDEWKIQVRADFLSMLETDHKKSLLELGAGTGKDSSFFSDHGLDVTCIDLSPEMVKFCKQKGLAAQVMDMSNLTFAPNSFDAIYSFNSLLHIPRAEFLIVLENVRRVLRPGGFFFLGMYGGMEFEGIWEKDSYSPKRFFSFHTDEHIQQLTTQFFHLLSFKRTTFEHGDLHFQALTLKK